VAGLTVTIDRGGEGENPSDYLLFGRTHSLLGAIAPVSQ
jgi:hypothetical protein